ncbi:MAG: G/U mismatch-specific uracil DNA glycosylase, partial [uncultured Solirubrobacteraceae bacterium]
AGTHRPARAPRPLRRDQPVAALDGGRPPLRPPGQPVLADAPRRRLHPAAAGAGGGPRAALVRHRRDEHRRPR